MQPFSPEVSVHIVCRLLKPCLVAAMASMGFISQPARASDSTAPVVSPSAAPAAVDANWSRFRGPNGTAVSEQEGIPVKWTPSDYLWQVTVPGVGHASPCIWGDRVFVNSAEDEGRRRLVICLDAATGRTLWTKPFPYQTYKKHELNSYASSTPATDGKRVYVTFDDKERYTLMAFDFDGRRVWDLDLGPYASQHGAGVSPIVYDGLVYLPNDQDGPSFLIAVDAETGKQRWKIERRVEKESASYATPFLLQRPGAPDLLVVASKPEGIVAYDAHTGERYWGVDPIEERTVSSPAYGNGMIFQTCGGGGQGHFLAAIRPVGADAAEVVWTRNRQLPYVPTPLVYGENLYLWGDAGVLKCLDAASGEERGTGRITGTTFFGSPVCIDGKLYCISNDGDVYVVNAAPDLELLATNSLGDPSRSTPAVAGGRLFLRTFHRLFCVGRTDAAK